MNFIKKWIRRVVAEDQKIYESEVAVSHIRQHTELEMDHPGRTIQFSVHKANGGRVVETRRYDRVKDQVYTGLYIIKEDEEFGKEIDKIITMECLK